jgi:methanogenic corrinoid protein MtbC1
MLSTTPTYNLKIVLKETGLPADTLRAWERRYGLPAPQRTEGGQRLYSQYDVETIKWLMARQAEGLSISHAVDLWNEHTASGVDLLAGALSSAQTLLAAYVPAGTTLDSIRANWLAACLDFKESDAEQILNKAFTMFPVEHVCMDVLQKGLAEMGQLWYENKASVQQEHFASGLAMRRLDSLLSASPAPSRKQTVMVGCPAGEWHTFTALLLALFLRRRGLGVIYLGANVPADQFEETVKSVRANLVVLVAQSLITAASLQEAALTLTGLRTPVAFGGRIFSVQPDLIEHISGSYLGNTLVSAIEEVERLLKSKPKTNASKQLPQKYLNALQAFNSKRTHIESTFKESLPPFLANSEGFNTGIHFLGDNIIAALQLGDMEYVTQEMEWVKVLMHSHKRPPQELTDFMQSYLSAVDKQINVQDSPIKDWLSAQINYR